jgi:hypothetical protein
MTEQGTVTTSVTVGIDIDLTHQITELLSGYLVLYKEPKFAASILMAFAAAHLVHFLLRAYCSQWRRVTIMVWILTAHMAVGAACAYLFLHHTLDRGFYAVFTGLNSIALYWVLLWCSTRLFKLPVIARWLSLRETKVKLVDNKPTIEFGETIRFLKK